MKFLTKKFGQAKNEALQFYGVSKIKVENALASNEGEGYVDTLIKMAIAVVIGSLILFAIIRIIGDGSNEGVLKDLGDTIKDFFGEAVSG